MSVIISAENIGKKYFLRHQTASPSYATMREEIAGGLRVLADGVLRRGRAGSGERSGEREEFWALRDVSFEVREGERIGIIGRNGAGKSTLLKVLSRITEPTSGSIIIEGRVASLLEVGTGFHPELTGRENIFLNGAILGMGRSEIRRKFEEIVAFAEIEKFLDTPVKRYSSGMYVRLAFSVAAHLEPDILIVDEVLAVGDAQFQRKCLGKMEEVSSKAGRTVLFVSHNLGAIATLCSRCILFNEGSVVMNGKCREVVSHYLNKDNKIYTPVPFSTKGAANELRLLEMTVYQEGMVTNSVDCRQPFMVSIRYEILASVNNARLFLIIRNEKGDILFGTSDCDSRDAVNSMPPGTFISTIEMPGNFFKIGTIFGTFGADIKNDRVLFSANDALEVHVVDSGTYSVSERHDRVGGVAPLLPWTTTCVATREGTRQFP
jgi:lipopolysaccharide transport system ATP-binding protein